MFGFDPSRSLSSHDHAVSSDRFPPRLLFSQTAIAGMATQDSQLRPAATKKQVSYTTPGTGDPAHHDFGPEHNSNSINRASGGSEKPFTEDLEAGNQKPIPARPTLFNRTFTQQFRAAETGEAEVDFASLSQKEKRQVVKSGVHSYIADASFKNRTPYFGQTGTLELD